MSKIRAQQSTDPDIASLSPQAQATFWRNQAKKELVLTVGDSDLPNPNIRRSWAEKANPVRYFCTSQPTSGEKADLLSATIIRWRLRRHWKPEQLFDVSLPLRNYDGQVAEALSMLCALSKMTKAAIPESMRIA